MKFLLLAFKLELRFFQLWPSRLAMKWTRILEDCASSWITSTSRTRTWIDQEPTKTNVASNFYSRRFSLKWLSGEIWRNTSWRKWHRILEKQITKRITRLYSSSCRMEEIAIASWESTGGRQPWRIWCPSSVRTSVRHLSINPKYSSSKLAEDIKETLIIQCPHLLMISVYRWLQRRHGNRKAPSHVVLHSVLTPPSHGACFHRKLTLSWPSPPRPVTYHIEIRFMAPGSYG